MKSLHTITRKRLAVLNRQEWEDFKQHWPMELLRLALDACWGTLLGILLGLSIVVWVLEQA
jgi:hypothetical protein